jgi:hypothetical protein
LGGKERNSVVTRAFDRFGGVLKFKWILILLTAMFESLFLIMILSKLPAVISGTSVYTVSATSIIAHSIIHGFTIWYCFYMLWLMPKREEDVPSSIGAFVIITAGLRTILIVADYLWGASSVGNIFSERFHFSEMVSNIINAGLWYQYFKESQRVKTYYGTNAFLWASEHVRAS